MVHDHSHHTVDNKHQHTLGHWFSSRLLKDSSDILPPTTHAAEPQGSSQFLGFQSKNFFSESDEKSLTTQIGDRTVRFEVVEDVTQRPKTMRSERASRRTVVKKNIEKSPLEQRWRLWMQKFGMFGLGILYAVSLVLMNVALAVLFYVGDDRCCDDDTMSFAEVFDFTFQTTSTIGYGGYTPQGRYANFLVVLSTYLSIFLNTIFAGLLYTKFQTPTARVIFSDVAVLSNINGLPCLQIRVANADGLDNPLSGVEARLSFTYMVSYKNEKGKQQNFGQRQELPLMNSKINEFFAVWTLRHVIDESSPLFGLNFQQEPGNSIINFQIRLIAIHDKSKQDIDFQTEYEMQDLMVGHAFVDQMEYNRETRVLTCDYGKLSQTEPWPVWYPTVSDLLDKDV